LLRSALRAAPWRLAAGLLHYQLVEPLAAAQAPVERSGALASLFCCQVVEKAAASDRTQAPRAAS